MLAFCGDDFTGSSVVMEVLTFAGLPTVMFLDAPSRERLARFRHCPAIGIARSRTPARMARELPRIFAALATLSTPLIHYKICLKMDSSAEAGSVGAAMDFGIPILTQLEDAANLYPVVFAAPGIRRYQAFGTLFATLDGDTYRLDRHPVLQRHPVLPMTDADVRLHLGRQTSRRIGLVYLVAM
ncbi:MAG: four-carbon acid sugar kinase family protein [Cypionkella sp.]